MFEVLGWLLAVFVMGMIVSVPFWIRLSILYMRRLEFELDEIEILEEYIDELLEEDKLGESEAMGDA